PIRVFALGLTRLLLRGASLGHLPPSARRAVRQASRLGLSPDEQADEAAIDQLRTRLAASDAEVEVVDHGAGTGRGDKPLRRHVAEVYRRAATGPVWGRFLYGLVRAHRPHRVLELGTNLGVGAAHLASALARTHTEAGVDGRLVTLEGAPGYAALARRHMDALRLGDRVEVVVGPFSETLASVCEGHGPFDLVFVDGHHEEATALRYVTQIRPHLAPGALVVLDDVEPGRPVRRAWARLAQSAEGSAWLGKYGLLVFARGE
ncbi:MAG: class I SAM-dependent methyltransferase, partial [Bacteroidota bacterium]